jgi:hypothetical protein
MPRLGGGITLGSGDYTQVRIYGKRPRRTSDRLVRRRSERRLAEHQRLHLAICATVSS